MKKFKAGDHLVVNIDLIGFTEHHGLCVSPNQVIHQRKDGVIEQVSLKEFADGRTIRRKAIAYNKDIAIERAKSLLGYQPYSLLDANCEHFVIWCIEETHTSDQVSDALHISTQVSARVGILGMAVRGIALGSAANIALASTVTKIAGEYIGLPDSVNKVLGTPGDLVAKPIESLINGTSGTLSTSADHLRDGEYGKAATSLVKGAVSTTVDATLVTPIKVVGDGIVAVADIGKDIWRWIRY